VRAWWYFEDALVDAGAEHFLGVVALEHVLDQGDEQAEGLLLVQVQQERRRDHVHRLAVPCEYREPPHTPHTHW
jgi:hypothetical protein